MVYLPPPFLLSLFSGGLLCVTRGGFLDRRTGGGGGGRRLQFGFSGALPVPEAQKGKEKTLFLASTIRAARD